MPEIAFKSAFAPEAAVPAPPLATRLPKVGHYLASMALVLIATGIAFLVDRLISASNLTLIYVLPVVITASAFGWAPSLVAVGLGSIAYDFFFTEPYYSLTMTNPPEIWAVVMLVIISTIVASVSATSRLLALKARRAAQRAEALQALAHAVVSRSALQDVLQLAAHALHRIFDAPAIILTQREGRMDAIATAGGAQASPADLDAALGALSTDIHVRAETYPFDRNRFDLWPVHTSAGLRCVFGVDLIRAGRDQEESPDMAIESVAGYVASALVGDSTL